jgi:chitin synthase
MVTLLDSFGNAKSALNPSASQHGRYLELHFNYDGSISAAKVLPFALNKSRVGYLQQDERSFHIFYQMLAGATPDERDELGLDDMDQYRLLASSNCYHLPAGPMSDDSTQLGELRASFAALGFKPKHVRSIFSVLTAILILSNITFTDTRAAGSLGMTSYEEQTTVIERDLLETVAIHLGVTPSDLEAVLVNRTKWVSHDLASVFLDAPMAETQRDSLMRDLYAILFAFVVEMANKRLAPDESAPSTIQIGILDAPGHQSRTLTSEPTGRHSLLNTMPLINVSGQNGFEEFGVNFCSEITHSYLLRRTFEDELSWNADIRADGVSLPAVITMENISCLDLLRGGPLGPKKLAKHPRGVIGLLAEVGEQIKGEDREEVKATTVISRLNSAFSKQPSFMARPAAGLGPSQRDGRVFGVSHWAGPVSYDATDFIDHNADVLDKQLVELLRNSRDSFITKLVSGPGLSTECHPLDDSIVVEAQVSSAPLRAPTPITSNILGSEMKDVVDYPIDTGIPQFVTAQLNATLATVFDTVDRTRVWGVHCIRPNDSGHANSYDRRRIKAQVRALLLPDLIKRREVDYIAEYPLEQFCVRHSMPVHDAHRVVEDFAQTNGWNAGTDYAIGNERIWLSYSSWREQEDLLRSTESRRGSGEETLTDEDNAYASNRQSQFGLMPDSRGIRETESMDNLIRSNSRDTGYGASGYYDSPDPGASAEWLNKNEPYSDAVPGTKEAITTPATGFVTKEKRHHATEVVATSSQRRWWIRITWLLTWWIPSPFLKWFGGMKRPDVRMAWREKVAICMMIAFMCGVVIFWIIGFGQLICPESDNAWNTNQLQGFVGDPDYYVAIAGKVYDMTNFWKGQHSDTSYQTSKQIMELFGGQELTNYFPPPLEQACEGLVTNPLTQINRYNALSFQSLNDEAIHWSGPIRVNLGQNETQLASNTWYYDRLMPKLKGYYKGYFVYDKSDIAQQGDGDAPRYWAIYKDNVYDLSNYFTTAEFYSSASADDLPNYNFLHTDITAVFKQSPGKDITSELQKIFEGLDADVVSQNLNCLNNAFYLGQTDFRKTPRCLFNNYLLLAFAIVLMTTIVLKCKLLVSPHQLHAHADTPQSWPRSSSVASVTPSCLTSLSSARCLVTLRVKSRSRGPSTRLLRCSTTTSASSSSSSATVTLLVPETTAPRPVSCLTSLVLTPSSTPSPSSSRVSVTAASSSTMARSTLVFMSTRAMLSRTSSSSRSASPPRRLVPETVASVTRRSCSCSTSTASTLTLRCARSSSKSTTRCATLSVLTRHSTNTSSRSTPIPLLRPSLSTVSSRARPTTSASSVFVERPSWPTSASRSRP